MVGWGDFGLNRQSVIIGDILSFLSVLAIVCYLLIGQNTVKLISHWIYSFCVFFCCSYFNDLNLFANVPISGYDSKEWGIFLLLAIVPTIAHVIYNFLLKYVHSATISMSVLFEPIGATILAAILLDETVVGLQIAGGFFVLLGVFLFLLQQRKAAANESYRANNIE